MDLELAGKVVLITGASGGLGREMAVDFAREDARVVVHYRSGVEAAEVVADTIENMGGEAITAQADLIDRSSVQHMLNQIKGEYGGVDVLIHGAVAFEGMGPIEQMAPDTWHKMIEVTLTGTYHLVNMIVPFMKQQRWGRIVNIASRTGLVGSANLAHYSAAKAGLIGMTKALAKELGPSGILVNAIAPTTILTPKERERLTPDRFPTVLTADVVHLAPIAQEVDLGWLDRFPGALIGVTPQGWLRAWDAQGRISPIGWAAAAEVLPRADVVIISIEDVAHNEDLVQQWAAQANMLVVTRGAHGCSIHQRGDSVAVPAHLVHVVDATGAGDIFAAAFLVRLRQSNDPVVAARFANGLASQSITRRGLDSIPTPAEIERFLVV